jgi:hypothetical protein
MLSRRFVVEAEIGVPPRRHRLEHGTEAAAALSELIDDARRDLGVHGAGQDALVLEDPQALGERLRASDVQPLAKLAEPLRAGQELADDQRRPLAVEDEQGVLDRAAGGRAGVFGKRFGIGSARDTTSLSGYWYRSGTKRTA